MKIRKQRGWTWTIEDLIAETKEEKRLEWTEELALYQLPAPRGHMVQGRTLSTAWTVDATMDRILRLCQY